MAESMRAVSVALCTHNGEKFIAEQLSSILDQSQPPLEVVLSDDASTDNTVRRARTVAARHLAEHPNRVTTVRIIENPVVLGIRRNFEQAIGACTSGLIALSDQDDVWTTTRLERSSAVFADRPELLLLHSDAQLIDESGARLGVTLFEALDVRASALREIHQGHAFEQLMRRNIVTGATTMIDRRLVAMAMPVPESWVHDEWLAIVAAATGQLDVLEEQLIGYRQHSSNQIGVRKLSVVGKLARLTEPGSDRNRRLLNRAHDLNQRLSHTVSAVPLQRRADAAQKLVHERVRQELPRNRAARILPVMRELSTGRYAHFGRGAGDALRDLLQPLRGDR